MVTATIASVSRKGDSREAIASESVEVSVVMPCLNEAETLAACIAEAQEALENHDISGEIIIADNGSTDGSQEIAERMGARVVDVTRKGYGSALMGGIQQARGQYIVMGDADMSYDFGDIPKLVSPLRQGADIVMGNRFRGGIQPGAMPPLHRYLGNPVLTSIGRIFYKSPSSDFHCGLRAFTKSAYDRMDLRTTGMEFASEMVVKAAVLEMKLIEAPTKLRPDGRSRAPHLRSWRDGWRHLRFLLLYSPRWLFLYPGLLLMIAGLAAGLWLLPGARRVGNVSFDVHTLLYSGLAVVLGFQSIVFAIFTKVFAISEGLLPEDPRLNRVFRYIKLETGLVCGAALLLLGSLGTAIAVFGWVSRQFGPLDPEETLRIVIPSAVCLTLGVETILSSFFLSVLGMRRK